MCERLTQRLRRYFTTRKIPQLYFSQFLYNCFPCVSITSGKGNVHAGKELIDEKEKKVICMLQKVEVLDKLETGMRIAAIRIQYNENSSVIYFIKKIMTRSGKVLTSVLNQIENIICKST
jgi:hypothetical protein